MHAGQVQYRVFSIATIISLVTTISGEICCCPDLAVSLKCEDKELSTNPSIKSSVLKANGYVCDSLEGSDVTLKCDVTDKDHDAVKSIKYFYYKAYQLDYNPFAYDSDTAKLTSCDETASWCVLQNVKWSGEVFSQTKFQNFHNFMYQCMAEVTLQDDTKITLSSNSMWLDVYKNIPEPSSNVVPVQEKSPINTGNYYERLQCGDPPFPATNPRSKAKWLFRKTEQLPWTTLNVLSYPRLALIEPRIDTNAMGSFQEGTLVIMLFDPETDSGFYKCDVEYTTDTVGEGSEYERAAYKIVASNQLYQGSLENKMLSAVTSKTYTTIDKGQYVEFNCFARDQDASVPGTFKWVYEKDSQLGTTVTVDPDTEPLFSGVHILNEGKTLRLPSKYEYYGVKFKCQVSRDTVTILSEDFNQPVIVPKLLYIPLTTRTCQNSDSNIELTASEKYMMSEKIKQSENKYVQKLTGATYRWFINDKQVSVFVNSADKGGVTSETNLKITPDVFDKNFAGTYTNQKCRYFSMVQTVSSDHGYQVSEVLKVVRPVDNTCTDLDEQTCNGITLVATCEEMKDGVVTEEAAISVTLEPGSAQCLTLEMTQGQDVKFSKKFDAVAPTCSARVMQVTITKADLQQEALKGEYTVVIAPEGKTGCTKTINYDTAAECSPTVPPEPVTACPDQYMKQDPQIPWVLNASAECVIKAAVLTKFDIRPSDGTCSDIVVINMKTNIKRDVRLCSLDSEVSDLEEGVDYELQWIMAKTEDQCKAQIKFACNGCDRGILLVISLQLFFLLYLSLLH